MLFRSFYWALPLPSMGCVNACHEVLRCMQVYGLVGSNLVGNNIFFVRRDRLGRLKALNKQEAYVVSRFRDSRDAQGQLNFFSGERRYDEIRNLPVVETSSGRMSTLQQLDAHAAS
jgi:hypothetical protein